jgi:hypothetical protein
MRLPAVYLFFFLLLATTQNGFQHQTGIHSLLLPSLTQQGTVTRPFTLVFDERFSTIPTVVFSIAGFEGIYLYISRIDRPGFGRHRYHID